ncbi:unnamed protein product [Dovyalis caffra]|uniref:Uncharacterized protein n=1 Tax=Dovyalis caffra TaxID=77055 RepID=A0AAV1SGK5_9ROSI|nr:unnamed protein product [Dovyalis caffra]
MDRCEERRHKGFDSSGSGGIAGFVTVAADSVLMAWLGEKQRKHRAGINGRWLCKCKYTIMR